MGTAEYSILAIGIVTGIFVAGGYGVIALPPRNFRAARACFWVAGIAFLSLGVVWAVYVSQSPHLWVRLLVAGVTGAMAAIALTLALLYVNNREGASLAPEEPKMADERDRPINVIGDNNVVSQNQSGGITARTVINQAPVPQLKRIRLSRAQNPDGTYTTTDVIEVISPFPVQSLDIEAHAPDILDLEVGAQRAGVMNTGHAGKREGFNFTSVQNPIGQYRIIVKTAGATDVDFRYSLE